MIVKKKWIKVRVCGLRETKMEGWFLFGIIPLYIRDINERARKS